MKSKIRTFIKANALVLLFVFIAGCGGKNESTATHPPGTSALPKCVGLFSPVQLHPSKTTIHLKDYFPNGEFPDKIDVHPDLQVETDSAAGLITIKATDYPPPWLSLCRHFGRLSLGLFVVQRQARQGVYGRGWI